MTAFAGVPRRRGKALDPRGLDRTFGWRRDLAAHHSRLADRLHEGRTTLEACPICGGADLRQFVVVYEFPYMECGGCGHLFSQKPPAPSAVRAIYAEDKQAQRGQAMAYVDEGLFKRRVEVIARPKVAHVGSVISGRGRWVDIGCATGEILQAATLEGWDAVGIEADATEAAFGRDHGLKIVEGFVTEDNVTEFVRGAQVVSLFNVMEHVSRPADLLRTLAEPLSRDAIVVIETPRHPSISALANQLFPGLACRHVYAPEHLHIFSEAAMERLLSQAGLRAISVWTFGQDFQELVCSAALAAGADEGSFIQRVLQITPGVQQSIDDAGFSDALFVVARKEAADR